MNVTAKLSLALALALAVAAPVQAQNPQQGDYYKPSQTTPQQLSPGQEQRVQQGDYYKPSNSTAQNTQQSAERDAAMRECIAQAHRAFGGGTSQDMQRADFYKTCMTKVGFQP